MQTIEWTGWTVPWLTILWCMKGKGWIRDGRIYEENEIIVKTSLFGNLQKLFLLKIFTKKSSFLLFTFLLLAIFGKDNNISFCQARKN